MTDAIYGCDGCRTTIGRQGCTTHRDSAPCDHRWVTMDGPTFCERCGRQSGQPAAPAEGLREALTGYLDGRANDEMVRVSDLFGLLDGEVWSFAAPAEGLRGALVTIRDCGPAHPAEDWSLPADSQITGADCQQAEFMRDTARAALYIDPSHSWSSSTPVLTHCQHGLDLRIHPRCYLCQPAAPAEGLASASPLRLAALRSTPAAPRCETCGGEADENGCLRNNCRGKATPADPGDHHVLP